MQGLRKQFPHQFWAGKFFSKSTIFKKNQSFHLDPNEFFSDGPLLNLGSDFGLMPSLFEPSGVVQQEFFVGGTPVIAFKTGGLRDSVFEYDSHTSKINFFIFRIILTKKFSKEKGNGFTFEAHTHSDFIQAITRSLIVFYNREEYAQLRKNCADNVWDVINVATGWANEFARLRKVMWASNKDLEEAKQKIIQLNPNTTTITNTNLNPNGNAPKVTQIANQPTTNQTITNQPTLTQPTLNQPTSNQTTPTS